MGNLIYPDPKIVTNVETLLGCIYGRKVDLSSSGHSGCCILEQTIPNTHIQGYFTGSSLLAVQFSPLDAIIGINCLCFHTKQYN